MTDSLYATALKLVRKFGARKWEPVPTENRFHVKQQLNGGAAAHLIDTQELLCSTMCSDSDNNSVFVTINLGIYSRWNCSSTREST